MLDVMDHERNVAGGHHDHAPHLSSHSLPGPALGRGVRSRTMAGVTYQEHLDFLIKQEAGARAERYGFVDAKMANATAGMPLSRPVPQWSIPIISDYEQMRYKQGYEDGKAMLSIERTEAV